ncbi:MAG: GMC family oxidoreductase [Myxococcales bacterium]|nr:MAG: GMC family oxidoreductase [Myxococcales bacterium]
MTLDPEPGFDADFIVVGSGFGGSVSALRLVEKGYRVLVLEAGRRWRTGEFPKTNWLAHKFLWLPRLGFYGIQRITLLQNVLVLSGAGVGGGSLVYANTLLQPPASFFEDPRWAGLADWKRALAPHYAEARRMLGATASRFLGPADHTLREVADELGVGDTFHQPEVAVYFGKPDEAAPDPYFGGEGPARVGCNYCGGCMVGCNVGAKNTLDKNYLYLAEKRGAEVRPLTTVTGITPHPSGGYEVSTRRTGPFGRRGRVLRARQVVLAGGVLGTVPLLLDCKRRGLLPALSDRLGDYVRTNSEAIVGALSRRADASNSRGIAITSGFYPEPNTHVEIVRYGEGQDAMGRLAALMVDGHGGRARRLLRFVGQIARTPLDFVRTQVPWGWAKRTIILLVMQSVDNHLRVKLRRSWWWPFSHRLVSELPSGQSRPPTFIPAANLIARKVAAKTDAVPIGAINEALLDAPTTAHILGGCSMGESATAGVIGPDHQVHHYPGLYVCDGSAISANLGVNPSLTITAMTELCMSRIAPKASA